MFSDWAAACRMFFTTVFLLTAGNATGLVIPIIIMGWQSYSQLISFAQLCWH
jgi:hypothetical protein